MRLAAVARRARDRRDLMWWFRVGRRSDGRRHRDDEGLLDRRDARSTFAAGDITFGIHNDGPSAHEFVILRTDDAPDALPVENGVIPEDQIDLVDEAEDIAPGTDTSLSANLTAGSYVLVCNLPSHYEAGMHAAFTVT